MEGGPYCIGGRGGSGGVFEPEELDMGMANIVKSTSNLAGRSVIYGTQLTLMEVDRNAGSGDTRSS